MADPRTLTTQGPVLELAQREWLNAQLPSKALSLEAMVGGASPRRFLRVKVADGNSFVLMQVPETTPDVQKARELGRRWPFLEVRDLLESRGVRVPRLLAENTEAGLLLVEDLGETLAERLEREPALRRTLYLRAVADLAKAQVRLDPLPEDSIVLLRSFDYTLLRWEIDHFLEFGLEARGVLLRDSDREVFVRAADYLANTLAALPKHFVHRDYQSRNLMVCGESEIRLD